MSNELRISSDEDEAESADYLVCVRATAQSPFTDNVFDFCCMCGVKVQHRPHVPIAPQRVCLECIAPQMEAEADRGELEMVATEKTAAEVVAHIRKERGRN